MFHEEWFVAGLEAQLHRAHKVVNRITHDDGVTEVHVDVTPVVRFSWANGDRWMILVGPIGDGDWCQIEDDGATVWDVQSLLFNLTTLDDRSINEEPGIEVAYEAAAAYLRHATQGPTS